jgi:hypothetical protein
MSKSRVAHEFIKETTMAGPGMTVYLSHNKANLLAKREDDYNSNSFSEYRVQIIHTI